MRDFDVKELQDFLKEYNVEFLTEPAQKEVVWWRRCSAMLQKLVPEQGLVDEECGDAVKDGHAGLCE